MPQSITAHRLILQFDSDPKAGIPLIQLSGKIAEINEAIRNTLAGQPQILLDRDEFDPERDLTSVDCTDYAA